MAPEELAGSTLARRWKYAAPPWRLYDALVDERDRWLLPGDGEGTPAVAETVPGTQVVFSPWLHDDVHRVEVLITTDDARSEPAPHAPPSLDSCARSGVIAPKTARITTLHTQQLDGGTEGYGAVLNVVAHFEHEPDARRRKEVRYRLGVVFGEALRHSVDGY